MAGGLIGSGVGYENSALSGFVRESAQDEQIKEANKRIEAQKDAQTMQLGGEIGGIGASFLFAALFL